MYNSHRKVTASLKYSTLWSVSLLVYYEEVQCSTTVEAGAEYMVVVVVAIIDLVCNTQLCNILRLVAAWAEDNIVYICL